MRNKLLAILISAFLVFFNAIQSSAQEKKILFIDSYHKGYEWSQDTNKGFCDAMLKFGYFDNEAQIKEFIDNDLVKTSRCIVKKLWMDTKRKSSKGEMEMIGLETYKSAKEFNPALIFLGDDNAAQFVGTKFLDTQTPVVFWGLNNTPLKYGLVDSMDKPGHNATGVYQSGYYVDSIALLMRIKPSIKRIAVLSDATTSGRSHYKAVEHLLRSGKISLELVETVATNSFEEWKNKALELQQRVDAFFIAQYSGLKDKNGDLVPNHEVMRWYLQHITIPETAGLGPFVKQGILCAADDSGYNQGYEAVVLANDILANGADPASTPPRTPRRGKLMVNERRAKMLGISISEDMGIEEIIN
ncbi:MAG: hypothetical protein KKE17_15325 [Proteobacteria bacterium]|nr:hypothetical protein [Pseudomonadota bacterium]